MSLSRGGFENNGGFRRGGGGVDAGGYLSWLSGLNGRFLIGLGGQSNMEGETSTNVLALNRQAIFETPLSAVQIYQRGRSITDGSITYTNGPYALQPRAVAPAFNMGPEISLGRLLEATFPGVWRLSEHSLPSGSLDQNMRPGVNWFSTPPNQYFAQWMQFLDDSEANLGAPLAAIVWAQGETDAGNVTQANNYGTNLPVLIAAQRAHKPSWAGTPWVIVELNGTYTYAFVGTVRAAEVATVAGDANTALVNTDDQVIFSNNHFDGNQQNAIGQRIAPVLYNLFKQTAPAVANFEIAYDGLVVQVKDGSRDANPILNPSGITVWDWNWNDGSGHGSGQSPGTHTYGSAGAKSITLTVTTADGRTATLTKSFTLTASTWSIDATARKGIPQTSVEMSDFLAAAAAAAGIGAIPAPLMGCKFSVASGNTIDFMSSKAWGPVAGITFQQPMPGYSSVGVKTADGSSGRYACGDASLPDLASGSQTIILLAYLAASGGSTRSIFEMTSTVRAQILNNAVSQNRISQTSSANTGCPGLADPHGGTHFWHMAFDRGAGEQRFGWEDELITVPIGAGISGKSALCGNSGGFTPPNCTYPFLWLWNVALSRVQVKAIGQMMNWVCRFALVDAI